MGAPAVIPTPTKSYVAINSIRSDRSIPPTLCDLGRVSSLAAAVILPRTSSFVTRNNSSKNTRSIPNTKRPISKVLGYSNSNTLYDNTSSALSITNKPNSMDPHANSCTHGNQLSNSATTISSTVETNSDRRHGSTSQAKRIKLESTITTSRMVSSPEASTADDQKNISVSVPEKAQIKLSSQYCNSHSTNLPPLKTSLMPVQLPSQETKAEPHTNKHHRTHIQNATQLHNQQNVTLLNHGMVKLPTQVSYSIGVQLQQQNQQLHNTTQLPNQQAVPLLTPGMAKFPTQVSHSIGVQIQQKNQQLHNITQLPNQQAVPLLRPGMVTLPTQVSYSVGVQLQQQNQQLRSENVLLQKQLSLFRQLMKNPQRLNQVLTRLDQRVH